MKRQSWRLLTHKDMEESPAKLSAFEKLVEVCRVATELYNQEQSQQPSYTNNNIDESWVKKPVQEHAALFSQDEILVGSTSCIPREELFKGLKTNQGESSSPKFCKLKIKRSVGDHDYVETKKVVKKKPRSVCNARKRVARDLYYQENSHSNTNNNSSTRCSVFDQVGQVHDKSLGKKPIQEDGGALFSMDEILACSTSCLPREELYKGSETNRGESSSARFCKLKIKLSMDDHDYFGDKKVVNDYNGDFLKKKPDRFIEEDVFDGIRERKRSRKYFDSCEYDPDFVCSAEKKKKKTRNISNARQKVARVTSPMPVEFKNEIEEMGGSDIKLIIQKSLFSADTEHGQNRFSIPMKQIREDFLTDKEEFIMDQRTKDNHVVPIMVPLIEPNLEKTQIKFRKWGVNSSYVLSCPWNDVRDRNALKVGMEMQLWSFRVDGALNFALVKV